MVLELTPLLQVLLVTVVVKHRQLRTDSFEKSPRESSVPYTVPLPKWPCWVPLIQKPTLGTKLTFGDSDCNWL